MLVKKKFRELQILKDLQKKIYKSCAVCGETWVLVWHYISHICWHLLFCFANLHKSYQGYIPRFKKKLPKFVHIGSIIPSYLKVSK